MRSFTGDVFSKIRTTIGAMRESGKGATSIEIENIINLAEFAYYENYWKGYPSKRQQIIDAINKKIIELKNRREE